MRCCDLSSSPIQIAGGGIGSGSESQFCYLPTTISTKSSPLLIKWSLRASASSSMNDGLVTEEGSSASLSFYELLGILESGSLFDIKQAYKQLARKYHPDVSPRVRSKSTPNGLSGFRRPTRPCLILQGELSTIHIWPKVSILLSLLLEDATSTRFLFFFNP